MYGHLHDGRFDVESQRHVLDNVQTKCLCGGPKCRCMETGCVQQKASCLLADDKDTKYKHKVHKGNLNLGQSWEQWTDNCGEHITGELAADEPRAAKTENKAPRQQLTNIKQEMWSSLTGLQQSDESVWMDVCTFTIMLRFSLDTRYFKSASVFCCISWFWNN